MRVKLSLLDRQDTLHYSGHVPVTIYDGSYRDIGICKVSVDDEGRHFGDLELDEPVNPAVFFYYRSMANIAGIFIFSGLDFLENEVLHSRTTTLGEMIIE